MTGTPNERPEDLDDALRPQWLVVSTGGRRFGIPVEQVREVVRAEGVAPIPGMPLAQAGIVNVRGAIVTVLDLQAALGGARAPAPASVVLVQHGARAVGLAVDAVHDVRDVEGESSDDVRVEPLDASAVVAEHLHSSEERER